MIEEQTTGGTQRRRQSRNPGLLADHYTPGRQDMTVADRPQPPPEVPPRAAKPRSPAQTSGRFNYYYFIVLFFFWKCCCIHLSFCQPKIVLISSYQFLASFSFNVFNTLIKNHSLDNYQIFKIMVISRQSNVHTCEQRVCIVITKHSTG